MRRQNPEFIELSIITLNDLNSFQLDVPQRHLVTIADLKFWGYGVFYSTLFAVKEMKRIEILPEFGQEWHCDVLRCSHWVRGQSVVNVETVQGTGQSNRDGNLSKEIVSFICNDRLDLNNCEQFLRTEMCIFKKMPARR
jgi:hypothetical protein